MKVRLIAGWCAAALLSATAALCQPTFGGVAPYMLVGRSPVASLPSASSVNQGLWIVTDDADCNAATSDDGVTLCMDAGSTWEVVGEDGGGATPGGSGSELQYRSGASTFGAVGSSSVSGANVTLGGTLTGITNLVLDDTNPFLDLTTLAGGPDADDSLYLVADTADWASNLRPAIVLRGSAHSIAGLRGDIYLQPGDGAGNGEVHLNGSTAGVILTVSDAGIGTTLTGDRCLRTDASGIVTAAAGDCASGDTDTTEPTGPAGGDLTGTYPDPTVAADSVALGSDTTGSYAAGDAEAGNATGVACTDCVALGAETTGNYAGSSSEGGAATTATALAANGTNCSAGNYPLGVDASGNAESCTAAGGSAAGLDTYVQYNDGGAFGGDSGLTFNESTDALAVAGSVSVPSILTASGDVTFTPADHAIFQVNDFYLGTDSCSGNCPTGARFELRTSGSFGDLRIKAGNDNVTTKVSAGGWYVIKGGAEGVDSNVIGVFENSGNNVRLSLNSAGQINFSSATEALSGAGDVFIKRARAGALSVDGNGFAASGDSQSTINVLRNTTTNNTPAQVFLDGSSTRMVLPNDTTWTFECRVVARRTDADGEGAGYTLSGVIDRQTNAASTALIGSVTTVVLAEDNAGWDAAATADTTNGALIVTVTGETSKTIRWVVSCGITEVTG